ncbi:phage distal tail protein [Amycolatopsis sp. NPDC088138]|uniref:phage distal tail protein n=1 Tax=Amycolatopsis sp. NPDC088138 TaxID=3363938 RepID=UPI0037FF3BA3
MTAEISTWVDPAGTPTVLDVDWDASGRFMPEPRYASTGVPGESGERFREVTHALRDFTVRLVITAANEGALRTALRNLTTAMNPLRGEGTFRVQSPLGDVREIPCRYLTGLGFAEKPGESGPTMQMADVTFRAFDPYWRDANDNSVSYGIGLTPTFFPIFPLRLTSSQIAVDATITNDGDVEVWPVIQITGPGTSITLRNLTTGKYMQFTFLALGSGESVTIDTRPGYKTIIKSDGTSIFFDLTATSSMWSLPVGGNAIRLEMGGALAGASSMQVSYRRKFLTP